jgi:hypothetical protein
MSVIIIPKKRKVEEVHECQDDNCCEKKIKIQVNEEISKEEKGRQEYKSSKRSKICNEKQKRCHNCKEWKDYDDFFKNKRRRDGYGDECKKCHKELKKKYRLNKGKKPKRIEHEDIPDNKKRCTGCYLILNKSEFSDNFKSGDGKNYKCYLCESARRELLREEGQKIVEEWVIAQGCECENCGEKNRRITDLYHRHEALRKELLKVKLLCSLCHLEETLETQPYSTSDDKIKKQQFVDALKRERHECVDCHLSVTSAPLAYFHFDHIEPHTKLFTIGKLTHSIPKIYTESKKCALRCKVCHLLRTRYQTREKWEIFFHYSGLGDLKLTAEKFNVPEYWCQEIITEKEYRQQVFERAYKDQWMNKIKAYIAS